MGPDAEKNNSQESPAAEPPKALQSQAKTPQLPAETALLRAVSLDGNIEALRKKIVSVAELPPGKNYEADPALPPIGNYIRSLIPDPKNYFTRQPAANDLTTAVHEEYHHVNSLLHNSETIKASQRFVQAFNVRLDQKLASYKGDIPSKVELTAAEIAELPNSNSISIYLPEFKAGVTIHQPNNVPKSAATPNIPKELWSEVTKLYLETLKDRERLPGQLFDEGFAYIVNARAALELIADSKDRKADDAAGRFANLRLLYRDGNPLTNKVPSIDGDRMYSTPINHTIDLAVCVLAHAKAVKAAEPKYFENSGYKELSAYLVGEALSTYKQGADIPAYNAPTAGEYYQTLMKDEAGKELRAFARAAYGEKWYAKHFGE